MATALYVRDLPRAALLLIVSLAWLAACGSSASGLTANAGGAGYANAGAPATGGSGGSSAIGKAGSAGSFGVAGASGSGGKAGGFSGTSAGSVGVAFGGGDSSGGAGANAGGGAGGQVEAPGMYTIVDAGKGNLGDPANPHDDFWELYVEGAAPEGATYTWEVLQQDSDVGATFDPTPHDPAFAAEHGASAATMHYAQSGQVIVKVTVKSAQGDEIGFATITVMVLSSS
jgi:hypothetical protein